MGRQIRQRILNVLLIFGVGSLFSPPLGAVTVVPVNLEYMTQEADRIFLAHVDKVEDSYDENGLWSQYITFQVIETYKGDLGDSLTIKQVNLTSPTDQDSDQSVNILAGVLPEYRAGQDVVVFLSPDSALGFTSSIGLLQGSFKVLSDHAGELVVVNPLQNIGLLTGIAAIPSVDPEISHGLSSARLQELRERPSALKLQNMKDLIRGLLAE